MKTSEKGLELIKQFEGCKLTAYRCAAGVLTIGVGHTGSDVKEGQKITSAKAMELLKKDVEKFEKNVMKYDGEYHWNQNQFDALVSFAFNIGSIDQLTASGTRSIAEISEKIPLYNKAGGKQLAGLVKRRAAEKALFDTPISGTVSGTSEKNSGNATKKTVKVVASALNCRNMASTSGKIVAIYYKGAELELIEKTTSSWYKVKGTYKGKEVTGYCSSKYLE